MQRELTDEEEIRWTCVRAYAGLSGGDENEAAAPVGRGRVRVVCTPSGGAKSVSLELQPDWDSSLGDEELLREIAARRET